MRPGLELVKCREHRPVEHIIQTKNHSCDPAVTPWDIKKEAESERPPPFRSSLMGSQYKAASQIETSGCFMGAVDNVPLRNYPFIFAANDETVALNIHPFSRINRHSPI